MTGRLDGTIVTTLAGDGEPLAGATFQRGELSRDLSTPAADLAGDPTAIFAGAVQALLAARDASGVLIGVALPTSGEPVLAAARSTVDPETPLSELVSRAGTELAEAGPAPGGTVRVAVAVLDAGPGGLDRAGYDRLGYELNWCDAPFVVTPSPAGAGRWQVTCDYDEDQYSAETIAGHLDRLDAIVARIAAGTGNLGAVMLSSAPVMATETTVFVEPSTDTERLVAEIWADVVGVAKVGATDDFFAIGGHSILAGRVVGRIRDALGVVLAVDQMFETSVLSDFAALVDKTPATAGPDRRPPLRVRDVGTETLSFGQERLWFLDRWRSGSALYNIPIAMRLTGPVDPAILRDAVQTLVDRHPVLRTALITVDGRPKPIEAPVGTPIEWSIVDSPITPWTTVREGVAKPFDLATPPLVRGGVVRAGDDQWLLWLSIHHVACDGWSLDILFEELAAAYDALAQGEAPRFPALPLQYADFAAWQRQALTPEVVAEGVAWWRERLAGAEPVLELPTDRRRPASPSHDRRGRRAPAPCRAPARRPA
jgi:hypothetical protein